MMNVVKLFLSAKLASAGGTATKPQGSNQSQSIARKQASEIPYDRLVQTQVNNRSVKAEKRPTTIAISVALRSNEYFRHQDPRLDCQIHMT